MMWRGAKEDLIALLEVHRERFRLSVDWGGDSEGYQVTPDEVLGAIQSAMTWEKKIQTKRQFVSHLKAQIKEQEEWGASHPDYMDSFMRTYLDHLRDMIRRAKGFDFVMKVDFGDNHGDYQGGNLGNCMDYEGRNIYLVDENLFYTTEQNR
jgi:hypothetical protein